jgi:hypothetical protein
MKLINFFKKISVKKKEEPLNKIKLDELDKWLSEKENNIKEKENKIIAIIKEKINIFNTEINYNIKELNEIDFEKKDANERVKGLVKQNLKKYIEFVEKLIQNLNKIDYNNFEDVIALINNNFINFEKKSLINYQRASFLIRKELIDIRKNIVNFSKEITEIFQKNRDIIYKLKRIDLIKQKLKEKDEFEKTINEINERIRLLNIKEKILKESKIEKEKNIDENKKDKEYIENLKKIDKRKILKEELKENIQKLKQNIDFKNLSNIYHVNENKMQIIKNYKENFELNYLNESGKNIIGLLEESKLNNLNINEIITKIDSNQKEINKIEQEVKEDLNKILFNEINKIEQEIVDVKEETEIEINKIEKVKQYRQETIDIIKEKLSKFNLILIF